MAEYKLSKTEEAGLVVLMALLFVLGAVFVVLAKFSDWVNDR